jgi:hypothetical protein
MMLMLNSENGAVDPLLRVEQVASAVSKNRHDGCRLTEKLPSLLKSRLILIYEYIKQNSLLLLRYSAHKIKQALRKQ